MQTAEQLFNDNMSYNKNLMKSRATKKIRIGVRKMTPAKVLEELEALNIKVSIRTLQRWVEKELIPKPKEGRYGSGGRWADYPGETIAEFVAGHSLIHHKVYRLKMEAAAEVRKRALRTMEELENPQSRAFLLLGHPDQFSELWITAYKKAKKGWPLDKPAEVRYKYNIAEPENPLGIPEYHSYELVEAENDRVICEIRGKNK